eukprot:1460507-Pyramimonas_sp.AAC.1
MCHISARAQHDHVHLEGSTRDNKIAHSTPMGPSTLAGGANAPVRRGRCPSRAMVACMVAAQIQRALC